MASNVLSALTEIRKYLSTEQENVSWKFISRQPWNPLIWMFCSKTASNLINNIDKRDLRLVYQTDDAGLLS